MECISYRYDITMDRIWTWTEDIEVDEKRLEYSFIHDEVYEYRYYECQEKWFPESVISHIEYYDDEPEYCEHGRDATDKGRKPIEKCPICILQKVDEWVFEMVEGGKKRHSTIFTYKTQV